MPDLGTVVAIIIGATLLCTIVFFTPLWGPRIVFGNLGLPSKSTSLIPAFSIADIFVLIGMLSPLNAAASFIRDQTPDAWFAILLIGANSIGALAWLLGAKIMERHRITRQLSRLAFQLVLHPLAIFAPSGALFCGMMFFISFVEMLRSRESEQAGVLVQFCMVSSLSFVFFMVACFAARRGFSELLALENAASHQPAKPKD